MTRKSQRDKDRALGALIKARYLEAAEARQSRETVWNDAYKRADPSYVDESKVKGPFKVKAPYVYRTSETQTGQLMDSSEANGRWVIAQPTTPEYGDIGEVVSQLLDNQFRLKTSDVNLNNEVTMECGARMGLVYGNSDFKIEWSPALRGCRVLALDPFDSFRDWKHGRWYIFRRIVTLREALDIAEALSAPVYEQTPEGPVEVGLKDKGRAIKAWRKLYRAIKDGNNSGYLYDSHYAEHGRQRQTNINRVAGSDEDLNDAYAAAAEDPYNARVVLLEYHETFTDGLIAQVVPNFGGPEDDLVFRSDENEYGACCIVPFIPRRVDNEQYGFGVGEVTGKTAEAMDVFYRAYLRFASRVADPAVLYNKHLRLRREYLATQSGISIPVNDTATDVRYMDTPVSGAALYQGGFAFARQMADLGSGESEQRRAGGVSAGSATEAAIMEHAGSMTDRRIYRHWRQTVEQVAHVMLAVLRVHITEEQLIPMLGRDSAKFYRLKPEYLRAPFQIMFGGNALGTNPAQRQMGYRNIASTYGPAGVVDVTELARADLREMGVSDPERFLVRKDAPESVSPRHEHIALFDIGQEIMVSPDDNDLAHILAHSQEAQRRPGHPAMPLFQAHIRLHIQAFQLKQQAQMGAQQPPGVPSAPGGAAPFQPSRAGGNGEPAVYGPRFANLNQQRQASNVAAGGGAPGPGMNRQVGTVLRGW